MDRLLLLDDVVRRVLLAPLLHPRQLFALADKSRAEFSQRYCARIPFKDDMAVRVIGVGPDHDIVDRHPPLGFDGVLEFLDVVDVLNPLFQHRLEVGVE